MNNFNIKQIDKNYLKNKVIHFCGIGGIGMSAIARLMKQNGFDVQGSDECDSDLMQIMQKEGIDARVGHDKNMIEKAGCVVFTSAVKCDKNEEILKAKQLSIPIIHRSQALLIVANEYKSILVSGAHGKTTNTSVLGFVLDFCKKDPAIISGGIMSQYKANFRIGKGKYIVFEADESDGSLQGANSEIALITNIDKEHMEYYKTMENIENLFIDAINKSENAILCVDDQRLAKIAENERKNGKNIITYGRSENADFVTGKEIKYKDGYSIFKIYNKDQEFEVKSKLYGDHNFQNLTGVFASAIKAGCDKEEILKAFEKFSGVKRRFTQMGTLLNALIIDDYAHHPTEISALISGVLKFRECMKKNGRVIAVFQPHKFSRTSELWKEFSHCFNGLSSLMICDVYSAGEENVYNVNMEKFVQNVKNNSNNLQIKQIEIDKMKNELLALNPNEEDIILSIGAGDITNYAKNCCDILF